MTPSAFIPSALHRFHMKTIAQIYNKELLRSFLRIVKLILEIDKLFIGIDGDNNRVPHGIIE